MEGGRVILLVLCWVLRIFVLTELVVWVGCFGRCLGPIGSGGCGFCLKVGSSLVR